MNIKSIKKVDKIHYMKPIRKAVRTILLSNNKVIAIKYITEKNNGYYDLPGGKIEENETSIDAAIREFKEETTMDIRNPKFAGNLIVEYPDRIYDFDVYIAKEYNGNPSTTDENTTCWIDIEELIKQEKKFSEIYLLDKEHYNDLLNLSNFKWHFISDENHNKINEII